VFAANTNACDDGNACTQLDSCSGGVCVGENPVTCTAIDSCHTAGACNPASGVCSNPAKPNGASCSDGNACTVGDACNNSAVCVPGPAADCDDGNACTADTCDTTTGCVHGDVNIDGVEFSSNRVDGRDLVVLSDAWNTCPGDTAYNAAADLDQTGCVDLTDFHLFMMSFGRSCP
jgi:hypothetical protein